MKKVLLLSVLMTFLFTISGCDNGLHNNGSHNNIAPANVRDVALLNIGQVHGCTDENVHQHNGVNYSGHYNNDGHGHNGLHADDICILSTCNDTALHKHNGRHYAGHHSSCSHGGHGNHNEHD